MPNLKLNTNKENTEINDKKLAKTNENIASSMLTVKKKGLRYLAEPEIQNLKQSALVNQANALFVKLEQEKAIKIQRAYRRYKIRQQNMKIQLKSKVKY